MNPATLLLVALLAPLVAVALMAALASSVGLYRLTTRRSASTAPRALRTIAWCGIFVALGALVLVPALPGTWRMQAAAGVVLDLTESRWVLAVGAGVVVLAGAAAVALSAGAGQWVLLLLALPLLLFAVAATSPLPALLALDLIALLLGASARPGGTSEFRALRRYLTLHVLTSATAWVGVLAMRQSITLPVDVGTWMLALAFAARFGLLWPPVGPLALAPLLPPPAALLAVSALLPVGTSAAISLLPAPSAAVFIAASVASVWSFSTSLSETDYRCVPLRWTAAACSAVLAFAALAPEIHLPAARLALVAVAAGSAIAGYCAAILDTDIGHRQTARLSGLAALRPGVLLWTALAALMLAGAPPFSFGMARLLALSGKPAPLWTHAVTSLTLLIGLACMLATLQRLFLSPPKQPMTPIDLTARQRLVLLLLATATLTASIAPMTLPR
jgi:hypothetical protein